MTPNEALILIGVFVIALCLIGVAWVIDNIARGINKARRERQRHIDDYMKRLAERRDSAEK